MNEIESETTKLSSDKPYIQFQNVSKKFGNFTAINDLTLDIFNNEFFSLLGPSGCGKTTLLRMLAGFEKPTNGRILLEGEDISNIPPHLRPINMMFQSYALFPHMTVEKNIAFGLKQDKLPSNKINQRVDEMLELVELTEFSKRKPNQLSGGQRQRVALARSLAKRPKLLLLDEPLGALDKRLREQTQFELMNIQEKLGITFIIVTHDQEEAMTVSSRIGVMDSGNVIQVSTPNNLYEAPATKSVAEFIGNVNLFEGVYKGFDDIGTKLKCEHSESIVYSSQSIDAKNGSKIWLAVRPEKLEIFKSPPDYKYNILKGTIIDIGYGGSFSTYHVKLPNGNMISVIRANRERTSEKSITWNDEVYLHWSSKSAVVLTE
ncbi:MAG TPA: ABC transporter ATP-binding protein [Candidatus Thioglobus sp.]|jgi:putrescine transport system ATP-binding protein|nr:ABC transporter ATP-binding protein [Candidatus Thioglobus sp.]HIL42236.1 ABC transporter ATP-binding protein [Gammaproteobacteria bacterium]